MFNIATRLINFCILILENKDEPNILVELNRLKFSGNLHKDYLHNSGILIYSVKEDPMKRIMISWFKLGDVDFR